MLLIILLELLGIAVCLTAVSNMEGSSSPLLPENCNLCACFARLAFLVMVWLDGNLGIWPHLEWRWISSALNSRLALRNWVESPYLTVWVNLQVKYQWHVWYALGLVVYLESGRIVGITRAALGFISLLGSLASAIAALGIFFCSLLRLEIQWSQWLGSYWSLGRLWVGDTGSPCISGG